MTLLTLDDVSLAYGHLPLLAHVNFRIDKGERVCLVGRNGTGKSTLMKILAGEIEPDKGLVQKEQGTRISYFSQDIPQEIANTVFNIVAKGLGIQGELLAKYHLEEKHLADNPESDHTAFNKLHDSMDKHNAWGAVEDIKQILTRMDLPEDGRNSHSAGCRAPGHRRN